MNRLQLIHLSSFFGFLNFSLFVFYHLGCNSFRLFNFQRSSPSSDSFYILSLSLPFVNTLFYLFLKVFLRVSSWAVFSVPCERACLYYHIGLCFVNTFFGFFRTFFFLYAKKPLKPLFYFTHKSYFNFLLALTKVFFISMVMVIGPTPPGTGVK